MGARMYPSQVVWQEGRGAERAVYEACRDTLDHEYSVFYSVPRVALDAQRRPQDGEADFVIAHPRLGIFVLEVKGGVVGYTGERRQWYSRSSAGHVFVIKDPFAQGVDAAHDLEAKLSPRLKPVGRYLRVGHAAMFPAAVATHTLHGLDKPAEIVLDATDLANMTKAAERVLAYYRGVRGHEDFVPGTDGVAALKELLYRPWQLEPVLWSGFKAEHERMLELTEQQFMVLDILNHVRQAAISGCAGSGKTLIAAEKAVRLARTGIAVLLTCFNKNLAAFLRERLSDVIAREKLQLDIVHYHELCDNWAKEAGITLSVVAEPTSEFFDHVLPQALADAIEKLTKRYKGIVVDEGQDFLDEWWLSLLLLLEEPANDILYIFYDDNQRIYVESNEFPVPADHIYPLTMNCRNTQNIHQFVSKFYSGGAKPLAKGPTGKDVEVRYFAPPNTLHSALSGILQRLTAGKDGVPAEHIAVLTPFGRKKSRLWESKLSGKLQLAEGPPGGPNQVYCGTIQSFKGLERPVIVLTELERWPKAAWNKLEALLYVGASRAGSQLIILLPEETSEEIRALVT